MNVSRQVLTGIAESIQTDYASLMAFIEVESAGKGFDPKTGKIIIQFEPSWFKRIATRDLAEFQRLKSRVQTGVKLYGMERMLFERWENINSNGVEGQAKEWLAFNAAYAINRRAALLCTSIGIMQVMGFNYSHCGYATVNDMWDDFKTGEEAQIRAGTRFIESKPLLHKALLKRDWANVAYFYNGANYAVNKYDVKMEAAHKRYSKLA